MLDRFLFEPAEEILKIPGPPTAPWGDPTSVEVFRPGRGYIRYRVVRWCWTEGWAIALAVVTLFFPHWIPDVRFLMWLKWDVLKVLEWIFLALLPVVLPVTFAWILLDYRNRRYVLTDRSLRIREGLWTVREMTISLANVQNVSMSQGPIQRLFGIADVDVSTAGGGELDLGDGHSMHRGVLRGVDNAESVRDRIVRSWNLARTSPDADEAPDLDPPATVFGYPLLAAADALASEATRLRETLDAR